MTARLCFPNQGEKKNVLIHESLNKQILQNVKKGLKGVNLQVLLISVVKKKL